MLFKSSLSFAGPWTSPVPSLLLLLWGFSGCRCQGLCLRRSSRGPQQVGPVMQSCSLGHYDCFLVAWWLIEDLHGSVRCCTLKSNTYERFLKNCTTEKSHWVKVMKVGIPFSCCCFLNVLKCYGILNYTSWESMCWRGVPGTGYLRLRGARRLSLTISLLGKTWSLHVAYNYLPLQGWGRLLRLGWYCDSEWTI